MLSISCIPFADFDFMLCEQQVVEIVTRAMESAAALSVPLTTDYGIGKNWLEAH